METYNPHLDESIPPGQDEGDGDKEERGSVCSEGDNQDELDEIGKKRTTLHHLQVELEKTINCMQKLADNVDMLLTTVLNLDSRIDDMIDENKTKAGGCGFSCSNNSFTL